VFDNKHPEDILYSRPYLNSVPHGDSGAAIFCHLRFDIDVGVIRRRQVDVARGWVMLMMTVTVQHRYRVLFAKINHFACIGAKTQVEKCNQPCECKQSKKRGNCQSAFAVQGESDNLNRKPCERFLRCV